MASFRALLVVVALFNAFSSAFVLPAARVVRRQGAGSLVCSVAAAKRTAADSKADFNRHKELWKGFTLRSGYKTFAGEFAEDGVLRWMDNSYVGRQAIEDFLETWPVVFDMKQLKFEEPITTANLYAAKWTATWSNRVGMKGETTGFVLAEFDASGRIKSYVDVADSDEYDEYLQMKGYGGNQ